MALEMIRALKLTAQSHQFKLPTFSIAKGQNRRLHSKERTRFYELFFLPELLFSFYYMFCIL